MADFFIFLILILPAAACAGVAYWALEPWVGQVGMAVAIILALIVGFSLGGFLLIFTLIGIGFLAALVIGAGGQ